MRAFVAIFAALNVGLAFTGDFNAASWLCLASAAFAVGALIVTAESWP